MQTTASSVYPIHTLGCEDDMEVTMDWKPPPHRSIRHIEPLWVFKVLQFTVS